MRLQKNCLAMATRAEARLGDSVPKQAWEYGIQCKPQSPEYEECLQDTVQPVHHGSFREALPLEQVSSDLARPCDQSMCPAKERNNLSINCFLICAAAGWEEQTGTLLLRYPTC